MVPSVSLLRRALIALLLGPLLAAFIILPRGQESVAWFGVLALAAAFLASATVVALRSVVVERK